MIQSLRPGELINLDPDEFCEYADKSIEDIAEDVMGVHLPQKSIRYQQMMNAAEAYFRLLRTPSALPGTVVAAENRLNILSEPFSDDPAFQALLKIERETAATFPRDLNILDESLSGDQVFRDPHKTEHDIEDGGGGDAAS